MTWYKTNMHTITSFQNRKQQHKPGYSYENTIICETVFPRVVN